MLKSNINERLLSNSVEPAIHNNFEVARLEITRLQNEVLKLKTSLNAKTTWETLLIPDTVSDIASLDVETGDGKFLRLDSVSGGIIAESKDTFTSTVTANTTTTLNLNSTGIQEFTGTSTQVVLLPDTSTLTAGKSFKFINNSTDEITLKDFTGIITLTTLSSNTNATVICLSTVSQAWEVEVNVGNPSLVSIDSQHILGRVSAGNGTVESLSKANVKSILGYLETEQDFADLIQAQSNIVSDYGDWLIPAVNYIYRTVDYFTAYNYKTYVLTGLAISDVSGLTTALSNKQATLVNQTNIKSINGNSLLGSGDLTVASSSDLSSIVLYLESIGLIFLVVNGNGDYVTDTNGNYIHTTFTKNIVTTG